MANLKMVLDQSDLVVTPQEATGFVKYYCDSVSGNQMDILNNAANSIPFSIGDKFPVIPQAGPFTRYRSIQKPGRTTHQLRVAQKHVYLTNNAKKVWVELGLRSPPTNSESSSSSLIQKRNEFYLTGNNEAPTKKQIVITYFVQPGQWGKDSNGKGIPATVTRQPQAPATCTKYFYTESFRVSSTFYYDEISAIQLQNMRQLYVGRINGSVFLYVDSPVGGATGDARQWLCTGIEVDSPDNGMTFRVTADWTYNIEYWDPIVVLTDSHGQPVKLTDDTVKFIMQSLAQNGGARRFNGGPIPAPRVETGGGAGRFPIYQAADHYKLLQVLRKEIPPSEL